MSRSHSCPGGCGAQVQRNHFACRPCWYRLPVSCREAIRQNHLRRTEAHAAAMHDAFTWYAAHPLPNKEMR